MPHGGFHHTIYHGTDGRASRRYLAQPKSSLGEGLGPRDTSPVASAPHPRRRQAKANRPERQIAAPVRSLPASVNEGMARSSRFPSYGRLQDLRGWLANDPATSRKPALSSEPRIRRDHCHSVGSGHTDPRRGHSPDLGGRHPAVRGIVPTPTGQGASFSECRRPGPWAEGGRDAFELRPGPRRSWGTSRRRPWLVPSCTGTRRGRAS